MQTVVRQVLLAGLLGSVAASLVPAPFNTAQAGARPSSASDVFLITIDTLRADHVGCYGDRSIRTPALDHLAADGIRFASAFTPSPITNASHASILTGLIPAHHGVRDFGMELRPDVPTLAEVSKAHGFSTAAFIGSVVLDSQGLARGFDRGFDYYDNFPAHLPKSASRYTRLERRGMDVERRAEAWMLAHPQHPKFIWVHFYDPHDPYDPPPPYNTEYAGRLYDGEIAYADSALGRFLEFLKGHNLYDASTLIVAGDHGEGLGEHGEQTHGIFLYDSTTHVPLIVKPPRDLSSQGSGPGAPETRGLVITAQVRTTDIFPTLLELEGIEYRKPLDGASLRPLWGARDVRGAGNDSGASPEPASSARAAFAETDYPLGFGWAPLRSVRAHGEKYIEAPRPEFYDLRQDPGETRNIYEPGNAEVRSLRELEAHLRKLTPSTPAEAAHRGPARTAELQALGYAGSNSGTATPPAPLHLPDPKDKIQIHNLVHSAMLAVEDGKVREARSDLESALDLDRDSAVALSELGELELGQRNYPRAADLLARALKLRPQDPTTALDEARARYAMDDLRGARTSLEASEAVLAGNYEARCLLGKIDAELKDWDKAEDPLEAAIILDASRPEAYIELARVYLARKQPTQALQQLKLARRLAPNSREVSQLVSQARRAETKSRPGQARNTSP
jgi:choline-sulfatase